MHLKLFFFSGNIIYQDIFLDESIIYLSKKAFSCQYGSLQHFGKLIYTYKVDFLFICNRFSRKLL